MILSNPEITDGTLNICRSPSISKTSFHCPEHFRRAQKHGSRSEPAALPSLIFERALVFVHAFLTGAPHCLPRFLANMLLEIIVYLVQARRVDLRRPWRMLLSVGDIFLDELLLASSPALAAACSQSTHTHRPSEGLHPRPICNSFQSWLQAGSRPNCLSGACTEG